MSWRIGMDDSLPLRSRATCRPTARRIYRTQPERAAMAYSHNGSLNDGSRPGTRPRFGEPPRDNANANAPGRGEDALPTCLRLEIEDFFQNLEDRLVLLLTRPLLRISVGRKQVPPHVAGPIDRR